MRFVSKSCVHGALLDDSGKLIQVSLVAQSVKKLPGMQETTWVRSLGWEDPLKEGMATHSSVLA